MTPPTLFDLSAAGCALLPSVCSADDCARLLAEWHTAQRHAPPDEQMRRENCELFAARTVMEWHPAAAHWAGWPGLLVAVRAALGPDSGLVRILFFDKPPERTWGLPWHQDLTIAVDRHRPSERFVKPTMKSGVPHVEAPTELLERMLTARLHLDPVDGENGPLRLRVGSHREGKGLHDGETVWTAHAAAGDVVLMRPLVAHASGKSAPHTTRHRRILHFEFAADPSPGDGFEWRKFVPLAFLVPRDSRSPPPGSLA